MIIILLSMWCRQLDFHFRLYLMSVFWFYLKTIATFEKVTTFRTLFYWLCVDHTRNKGILEKI